MSTINWGIIGCGDVTEKKILQSFVLNSVRTASTDPFCVNPLGLGARRVGKVETAKVGYFKLLSDCASGFLPLQRRRDYAGKIFTERRRNGLQSGSLEVLQSQALLERKELPAVRILLFQPGVIEGEKQRIDIRDPQKARCRKPGPHRDTIAQHCADASLIQHPDGIVPALTRLHSDARFVQPLHGIAVERSCLIEAP